MSLSKVVRKCQFCGVGNGIYTCPRCSRKYCSSYCYKSREHESCSESFFKEWVKETLADNKFDRFDKESMLRTLINFEENSAEAADFDDLTLEDKLASIDINNVNESVIWEKLGKDEKAKFKSFIEDKNNLEAIVPVKQPWWLVQTLNLVSEIGSESNELSDLSSRPPFPLNCKKLFEMTSTKPSSCIRYNLINIVYAYAFLYRFYNCDLRDFLEEVVDSFFIFCPVLNEGKNYLTLAESVQDSIRLISTKHSEFPVSFIKSIIDDISNIMNGPNNARSSTFVLCSLHDIKLLLLELKSLKSEKKCMHKELRKKLTLSVKKIEYYISWSLEFENILAETSSELIILMLPDLIPDSTVGKEENITPNEKHLIEEID